MNTNSLSLDEENKKARNVILKKILKILGIVGLGLTGSAALVAGIGLALGAFGIPIGIPVVGSWLLTAASFLAKVSFVGVALPIAIGVIVGIVIAVLAIWGIYKLLKSFESKEPKRGGNPPKPPQSIGIGIGTKINYKRRNIQDIDSNKKTVIINKKTVIIKGKINESINIIKNEDQSTKENPIEITNKSFEKNLIKTGKLRTKKKKEENRNLIDDNEISISSSEETENNGIKNIDIINTGGQNQSKKIKKTININLKSNPKEIEEAKLSSEKYKQLMADFAEQLSPEDSKDVEDKIKLLNGKIKQLNTEMDGKIPEIRTQEVYTKYHSTQIKCISDQLNVLENFKGKTVKDFIKKPQESLAIKRINAFNNPLESISNKDEEPKKGEPKKESEQKEETGLEGKAK